MGMPPARAAGPPRLWFLGLGLGDAPRRPAPPGPRVAPISQAIKLKPREVVLGPRGPSGAPRLPRPGPGFGASETSPGARGDLGWAVPPGVPVPRAQAPLTSGTARRRRPGAQRFLNPGRPPPRAPARAPPPGSGSSRRAARPPPPPPAPAPPRDRRLRGRGGLSFLTWTMGVTIPGERALDGILRFRGPDFPGLGPRPHLRTGGCGWFLYALAHSFIHSFVQQTIPRLLFWGSGPLHVQ